jgi:hypothetical protein
MANLAIGVGVCALTFGFGYAGMWLQKLLPESHMTSGARDMIGAVMGLIALLLALVLGTLVGSAYGFYATQKANVEVMAARSIQLDMALKSFGPEAAMIRAGLKRSIVQAYNAIWVDHLDPQEYRVRDLVTGFDRLNNAVAALKPTTPEQTAALPTINVSIGIIEQTRFLMALQLASPISWPLLIVVVSWAMLLFAGYGVMARLNGTAVFAAFIGAFAVGSAVFLILELNQPFIGLFRLPAAAMQQTIAVLGQ